MAFLNRLWAILALVALAPLAASAEHRVITHGNGKLAIVGPTGQIEWEMKWGAIHDLHVLKNGNLLVQKGPAAIAEIDRTTRDVVWSYDSATQNGNAGKAVEVHSFQPIEENRILIAESGVGRLIEVDRQGTLHRQIPLKRNHPHPHTDTRLVRKLKTGNYLVCQEGDGFVREYDGAGDVVWEFEVPLFGKTPRGGHGPEAFGNKCFAALRLPSGNTLIATGNGHSVIEVTPAGDVAWKVEQSDLEGIRLAWVTTLEVLPNGHIVLGNCHAGPGQPLLVEVEPKTRRVVWRFDQYDTFGNNVSNSQLLDVADALR